MRLSRIQVQVIHPYDPFFLERSGHLFLARHLGIHLLCLHVKINKCGTSDNALKYTAKAD